MLARLVAFAIIIAPVAVGAQGLHMTQTSEPAVGVEATASTGSPIFVRERFASTPSVVLKGEVNFRFGWNPRVRIAAGTQLPVNPSRDDVQACVPGSGGNACVIDRDKDGAFEVGRDVSVFTTKIDPPVPYEPGPPYRFDDPRNFRQQLTYLGVSGQTLRLSYREFANDMARPAFTDEVTFTLSGKFPETIAYKDVVIDVLGISNAGIRYVVTKAGQR